MLVAKPDGLSSISRTHTMEGELPQVVLQCPHKCVNVHTSVCVHTQITKCKEKLVRKETKKVESKKKKELDSGSF